MFPSIIYNGREISPPVPALEMEERRVYMSLFPHFCLANKSPTENRMCWSLTREYSDSSGIFSICKTVVGNETAKSAIKTKLSVQQKR